MADFRGAVLYHCSFMDCDLTKAQFTGSFMSGFRLKDVDLTHVALDLRPKVGRVRKPLRAVDQSVKDAKGRRWLVVGRGEKIPSISTVESTYNGLWCTDYHSAVVFSDDPTKERWRSFRRREEVAKILKVQLQANGYHDRALQFYREERRFRRLAMPRTGFRAVRRGLDFFFGELFWAYGTSIVRPLATYVLFVCTVAASLLGLGSADSHVGMVATNGQGREPGGTLEFSTDAWGSDLWMVCFFLATCAFGNSSLRTQGMLAEILFAIYCIVSVGILTLTLASAGRRLANV